MVLTNAHDGATHAVAWILAALLLVAVFEAVTIAILITAKRKAHRAAQAITAAPVDEEVAA